MMITRSGLKVKSLKEQYKNQKKRISKLNTKISTRQLSPPSPVEDLRPMANRTEPPTPEEILEPPQVLAHKNVNYQNTQTQTQTQTQPCKHTQKKSFKELPSPYSTTIKRVVFDKVEFDTLTQSFYPSGLITGEKIYICEVCFKYFNKFEGLVDHRANCCMNSFFHPEDLVYEHGKVQIYEIDGSRQPLFCQCLCLFTRLFLTSKALCYDVHLFKFYILRVQESHTKQYKCVGYELSKLQKVIGTPERPLSEGGLRTYLKFWASCILDVLLNVEGCITLAELSQITYIHPADLILTLEFLEIKNYLVPPHTSADCDELDPLKTHLNTNQILNIMNRYHINLINWIQKDLINLKQ